MYLCNYNHVSSRLTSHEQILVGNNYRITSHVAKKYRTLSNSCTEKVDKAWEQLEDEFGEDVPVRVSYVVGKKDFQKLVKEDMLNTIKEFAELYRTNSARCTETCELTYFLYFICKIIYTEFQIFLDIDVGYRRCPESVFYVPIIAV